MRRAMLEALEKKYEADIASADATIQIYLNSSVGIGEHPQHLDEIDYVTLPNSDFAKICEYAELDHNLVRKKVINTLNNMEKNYDKDNMPEMPWKRLYQSKGINRESSGNHTSVSEL